MTRKGFGTGICVYCGRGDAPTIGEHIFGRQLFLTRHRDRLPKVPSCEACNTTKSQLESNWEPRIRHATAAQEAEGAAAMEALVGPNPEAVHQNLGEGTVEYWGQRSRRLPYCSFWRFILFGGLEWSGNPEAPHETYSTILCGTFRKENTSSVMEPDERRDFEQVALDGDAIYWSETQPQKQGRTFLYRAGAEGEPECVTPDDADAFSVRTRAHEYGGGSFAVSDGVVYFSNNRDQRLYRHDAGRPPSPITQAPVGAAADALRYADGVVDRRRRRMVCVREDHTGAGEAITTLVGVDLSGAMAPQVLVSGNDFYSTPRLSPTETACPG